MKVHFHKVPIEIEKSFSIQHSTLPFGTTWHCHPELELHYVIRGEGVRFIGNNISSFSDGELVLLGADVPHTWHCKEEYFNDDPACRIEAVVVHFLPNCMGDDFLVLPEARSLTRLYEIAKGGLLITNQAREKIIPLLRSASELRNLDRFVLLLTILSILSKTNDYQQITKEHSFYKPDEYEAARMNSVCDYTMKNFFRHIPLEEIAGVANLTRTSFCRYFKLITGKSYINFLTEIRVSHACGLLIEDRLSVGQLAEKCGFSNIPNFYRQFNKVVGTTPFAYKRRYLKAVN